MTLAKLPRSKHIEQIDFTDTPIKQGLVYELATCDFPWTPKGAVSRIVSN